MKLNILILIVLIFSLTGCTTDKKNGVRDDSKLVGSWYELNKADSTYTELYFSKAYVIYNMNHGLGPLLQYEVINDSILVFPSGVNQTAQLLFKIKSLNDEYIELVSAEGSIIQFKSFSPNFNVWKGLNVSEKAREKVQKLWYERYNEMIYGPSKEDSIYEEELLTIPEVRVDSV